MGDSKFGTFSTPLRNSNKEHRGFASERPHSKEFGSPYTVTDRVYGSTSKALKENGSGFVQEYSSPWKRPKLDKGPEQVVDENSSPAVIEMFDKNREEREPAAEDIEELEVQEEISQAVNSVVGDVSVSDSPNQNDQHRTSLLNNILSPKLTNTPNRSRTPDSNQGSDLGDLGTLTPPKNYMHRSENTIIRGLQKRYKEELEKYEQYLRAKNEQAEGYRQRTIRCFDEMKGLEEALDEQKLAFSALLGEHEVLKASQDARNAQQEAQQREIEKASSDKAALEARVSKLKLRLSETRNEMKMISQNSQILQDKFQSQIVQNEKLEEQASEVQAFSNQLQLRISRLSEARIRAEEEVSKLRSEATKLADEKFKAQSENEDLKLQVSKLDCIVRDKSKIIEELQANLKAFQDSKQRSAVELEYRITDLTEEKNRLVQELEAANEFKLKLEKTQAELELSRNELSKAKSTFDKLHEDHLTLEDHARTLELGLQKAKEEAERAEDDKAVHTALASELENNIEELRRSHEHLEEALKNRSEETSDWKAKFEDKCVENNKLTIELESYQYKNGNLETEHLVELEQLHQQMTSLQETLKSSSEKIQVLNTEKASLKEQLEAQKDVQPPESVGADPEQIEELHSRIDKLEQQLDEKEAEASKRLQLLAEDLYIQYSSKHEQKVKLLKKGYEAKYQDRLERVELENTGMKDEITQLNSTLQAEREEKHKLLKLLNKEAKTKVESTQTKSVKDLSTFRIGVQTLYKRLLITIGFF